MTPAFRFDPVTLPPECQALRGEVRAFLAEARASGLWAPAGDFATHHSAAFSRALGERGWIGMTWPRRYGGQERSALERYVVTEEMLVVGAPVAAHWIADRQSGPLLLRYGTEEQRQEFLPKIARGECFFCIGMSEPDSGSDLASIRTRAEPVEGGFRLNGRKVWTSHAHRSHYAITLCRTAPADGDRHQGLSQLIVDVTAPGITVRPIRNLAGDLDFTEVTFDDVFIPANRLVGAAGDGWKQVTSELAFERSGPERFLSSFALLVELTRALGKKPSERGAIALGRLTAHILTLRRLSRSVAGMLQAALVKDLGTLFEQEVPEIARLLVMSEPTTESTKSFVAVLAHTMLHAPSYSIRGGTREILRGIIARGLGLR